MADDLNPAPAAPSPAPEPAPSPAPPAPAAPSPAPEPAPSPAPAAPSPAPSPAPAPEPPPAWPEDWRTRAAKGDEKREKRLGRYASPEAALDALIAAQDKISTGKHLQPPGADASPEELAEWRERNGIPPSADKYEMPADMALTDIEKEMLSHSLEAMHKNHVSAPVVKEVLAAFNKGQEAIREKLADMDATFENDAVVELKDEWGADFKRNNQAIANMLAGAPAGVADALAGARGPDGKLLKHNTAIQRWLVSTALEINPVATLIPNNSGDNSKALGDEISSLEKMMSDRASAYWKGSESGKLQARYRDLITARDKLNGASAR